MGVFEVRVYAAGRQGRVKRGFHLKIEDADMNICFGLFLAKYGEQILSRANKQKSITRWVNNTKSFPMKLILTVNNTEQKCFDNSNKMTKLMLKSTSAVPRDTFFSLEIIDEADQGSFDVH